MASVGPVLSSPFRARKEPKSPVVPRRGAGVRPVTGLAWIRGTIEPPSWPFGPAREGKEERLNIATAPSGFGVRAGAGVGRGLGGKGQRSQQRLLLQQVSVSPPSSLPASGQHPHHCPGRPPWERVYPLHPRHLSEADQCGGPRLGPPVPLGLPVGIAAACPPLATTPGAPPSPPRMTQ